MFYLYYINKHVINENVYTALKKEAHNGDKEIIHTTFIALIHVI